MDSVDIGDRVREMVTRWNIGVAYEDLGDLAKAEEYINQSVQIAKSIGHPKLEYCRKGLEEVKAERHEASL